MRILLAGEGDPIPTVALPDDDHSGTLPPQSFYLSDGVPFLKADLLAQGYTNYEVWCVGAAGGNGGGITYLNNPYGGAGGGGGLHRVDGLLADLPAACPVVVGRAGAAGRQGNGEPAYNPVGGSGFAPNPAYISALPGQDGGGSSFNGALCRASGGKGGAQALNERVIQSGGVDPPGKESWRFISPGGVGGEGGLGGRAAAGGGGAGGVWVPVYTGGAAPSSYTYTSPKDGAWDGDVGGGGGGGLGGMCYVEIFGGGGFQIEHLQEAQPGAQGSWSFLDTSVYGARQDRSYLPVGIASASRAIVPGGGGGARLNKIAGYGSKAPSYSPDGAVFIRVTQLV